MKTNNNNEKKKEKYIGQHLALNQVCMQIIKEHFLITDIFGSQTNFLEKKKKQNKTNHSEYVCSSKPVSKHLLSLLSSLANTTQHCNILET